jgi:hypothetical protein
MRSAKIVRVTLVVGFGTITLATAGLFSYLYGNGPDGMLNLLFRRPVSEPTTEEYAVYSAFLDKFFSSDQPFRADQTIGPNNVIFVVGETVRMENESAPLLPLQVAALGSADAGDDFFRQNTRAWPLKPRFRADVKWRLVNRDLMVRASWANGEKLFAPPGEVPPGYWLPHQSRDGPFPDQPAVSGVIEMTRIGMDYKHRAAILYYNYRCGILCGQSGWAAIHKIKGAWRADYFGSSIVY